MQALSSSLPSFSSAADLQLSTGAFQSLELRGLSASTETHTDLSVITSSGDRVTLSAESLLRASYADLNYQSTDKRYHLNLGAADSEVQVRNSVGVSIEGQLDQQEEADLQRLMGKLEKIVKKFLRGDIEGALSKALKIDKLGTVASFQLTVQHSEQISIAEEQSIAADGFQALRPQNVDTEDTRRTSSLVDQIVNTTHDTKIDLKKLLKRLPHMLRHLFEKFDAKISDRSLARLSSDIETSLNGKPLPIDLPTERIGTLA